MSILVNKDSKVVVQGITGSEGQFHAGQMLEYGTNIVAGVTPGKGGQKTLDDSVPVFNSVEDAVEVTSADTSIIFVPPPFAAEAVMEASFAGIKVVVCITEGIPVLDMVAIKKRIIDNNKITFPKYLHEDIPYIFEVYLCSKKIKKISKIIYFKKNRKNSILNTLNQKRISGLLTAWKKLLKIKYLLA